MCAILHVRRQIADNAEILVVSKAVPVYVCANHIGRNIRRVRVPGRTAIPQDAQVVTRLSPRSSIFLAWRTCAA